jgi:hypothetical protein
METRSRTRLLRRASLAVIALGALVVPATADAAKKPPVVRKITPKTANVGDTLVITGKYFRAGKGKNTLLFKRDRGKALFVKSGLSTTKKITLVIPKTLEKYMTAKNGLPVASRFRVRVLTTKLSKAFTSAKASPVIGPEKAKSTGGGGTGAPVAPTLDPNADCDGDGLTNGFESGTLGTQPCNADSDGDGVTDGFEYASAVDLNNDEYRHPTASLPYPGKRPYPNPLDAGDLNVDHDGDSLTLGEEYELWHYTVLQGADPSLQHLTYSAGLKYSIHSGGNGTARVPALAAAGYDKQTQFVNWLATSGYAVIDLPDQAGVNFFDVNRNGLVDPAPVGGQGHAESSFLDTHGASWASGPDGWLSDDERDEDADGLSNFEETHGEMSNAAWWKSMYPSETPYTITYSGTSVVDADSDGDGVRDGADDQDHDDVPNFQELSRNMITGRFDDPAVDTLATRPTTPLRGRVNPFNPCLPFIDSRTCPIAIPFNGAWAPFDRDHPNAYPYYVVN